MNNTFGLKENELENIIAILRENREVEEAFIFGSRAKGNHRNGSDVDIALKGTLTLEIVLRISLKLNEETLMPYKFDILDFQAISNNELVGHINRVGVRFYLKKGANSKSH